MFGYNSLLVIFLTVDVAVSLSTLKQNIVLLYVENINEVIKLLKVLGTDNIDDGKDNLSNIGKLYTESVKFHNMYGELASASNFGAILTGKSAVDLGLIRGKVLPFDYFPSIASSGGLDPVEKTIAEVLKDNGYRTWFTGYWKLGLGPKGNGYPIKHGFDTWMGVAHPHDEWCRRKDINEIPRDKTHPYMNLLYKISFIWSLVFLLLTTLVWLKFIGVKLFINLIIYTFSTSFAFYVLLHLFMIQRSASCVLYYHDFIYKQPYDVRNLTLHFTKHSTKLINLAAGRTPFFMILNYLKMKPPYFHSNFFRTQSTSTWSSSLLELDWSIGQVVDMLKEMNVYNDTVIIMTGSNSCEMNIPDPGVSAYERVQKNVFQKIEAPVSSLSNDCLVVPFIIKDISRENAKITTSHVYDHVSITDTFQTVLELSSSDESRSYPHSLVKLYKHITCKEELLEGSEEESSPSETALAVLLNNTFIENTEDIIYHAWHKPADQMSWNIEQSDNDVIVEAYIDKSDSLTCFYDSFYNKRQYLFHYYDVVRPRTITYKGNFKMAYTTYTGMSSFQKETPVIIDLLNQNITQHQLEEVYQNITQALQQHLQNREGINTYSSEFEMPVYPWLLPCANFPRCETMGEYGPADFSDLMNSVYDGE